MEFLDNIVKQNNKPLLKIINTFYKFKKQLNDFFNSNGYYDIFMPNMKILGSEYKEYHDKLIKLNDKLSKELRIKYGENMKVIISKDND